MKTRTSKRVLTLVLAVVLTFVLAVSAFATWSSYQGNQKNNGRITSGQPPITNPTTTVAVPLPTNNPDGSVFTGVDAASVIQGNYAFTLYNGGVSDSNTGLGGARMQATNVTTGATLWNLQLDADASNDMQLSTPYYSSSDNTIYATVTRTEAFQTYTSMSGWTASGATITGGTATFTGGNQSVSTTLNLTTAVSTIQLSTDLALNTSGATGSYTITLSDNNSNAVYTLASGGLDADWYGTYATYNGDWIPAGAYTLTFSVDSLSAGSATLNTMTLSRYYWRLYSVSSANTSSPVLSSMLATGEGQINTHINCISKYLFFGGFGGDHAYYQYGPIDGTASLKKFIPGLGDDFDDFYYAGASMFSENDSTKVVFGSESGKVYIRPVGDYFDSAANLLIDLNTMQSDCGNIRSSICVVGSDWYLSSNGADTNGYLWRITQTQNNVFAATYLELPYKTTSTPAVSSNNYIYLGYNYGYTIGGVYAIPADFTDSTTPVAIYSGDPVQASPIVYTSGNWDYVYFTTNSYTGAGYCYRFNGSSAQSRWTAGGTSTNRYAVQGFSSENGYLVYGDDGSTLYIMH